MAPTRGDIGMRHEYVFEWFQSGCKCGGYWDMPRTSPYFVLPNGGGAPKADLTYEASIAAVLKVPSAATPAGRLP